MNVQIPPSALTSTLLTPTPAPALRSEPGETFHQALANASSDDKKLGDAAKQFEAVMAGEILKAARASSQGGWLGSDQDDQIGEMTLELADQGLAQGLAAKGSFGVAKMVLANLHRNHSTNTNSSTETSSATPASH
jgi:Rod binding domain-containing protein